MKLFSRNQYEQKPEVSHTFTPKKALLNVEPSNLVFLETYNTDFDETIATLPDQNSRPLEIEDKVNLNFFLLLNRNHTMFYRTKSEKYVKVYEFLSFTKNISDKYGKQLLDNAIKTGLNALKATSKKVFDKAAEISDKFIGNKIAGKIVKRTSLLSENSRNVEGIVIPPEKRQEILNESRQVL